MKAAPAIRPSAEGLRYRRTPKHPEFKPGGSEDIYMDELENLLQRAQKDDVPQLAEAEEEELVPAEHGDGPGHAALAVLQRMKDDGSVPTIHHFNAVLNVLASSRLWKEASSLLKEMSEAGVPPDTTAHTSAIRACEGVAPGKAIDLLRAAVPRGMMPTIPPFFAAIEVLVSAERHDEAKDLLDEMQRFGLLQLWKESYLLDLTEVSTPVAKVAIRGAVEQFSANIARRKAGKGSMTVLTGGATRSEAHKQRAVVQVLRSEFGFKVRADPPKIGRLYIRYTDLQELAGGSSPCGMTSEHDQAPCSNAQRLLCQSAAIQMTSQFQH
eukprot:CAMPEP_0178391516 /NCGR_PEP_ID=MMETSP0689_2-20121128/11205_1 /TAXON_ID=160604 /ORGANISM="Amphidinium massartii, Strain CS-259" /LENGTH=324 /DNA_ID=CAMNT_0020012065 /DNA_START=274 /DNA_END=1246 /DNA_ORIENTATION=+